MSDLGPEMPKRTNDFQDLVTLIRRSVARVGDKVTPSAMVRVDELETDREIDILHETCSGEFRVKIAVEAKDEGRKFDLTAFDALYGKYHGDACVQVDKLVIVARKGFTKSVVKRAQLAGVSLFTLDKANEVDWSKFGPEHQIISQWSEVRIRMEFKYCRNEVVPRLPPQVYDEVIAQGRMHIGNCHSACRGVNIERFVEQRLMTALRRPEIAERFRKVEEVARTRPGGELFHIHFPQRTGTIVRHKEIDYPVEQIVTYIRVVFVDSPVDHAAHLMASTDGTTQLIHSFSADVGDFEMKWTMPEGLKSEAVGFSLSPEPDALPVTAAGTARRPSPYRCQQYLAACPPAMFAAVVQPFANSAKKGGVEAEKGTAE